MLNNIVGNCEQSMQQMFNPVFISIAANCLFLAVYIHVQLLNAREILNTDSGIINLTWCSLPLKLILAQHAIVITVQV